MMNTLLKIPPSALSFTGSFWVAPLRFWQQQFYDAWMTLSCPGNIWGEPHKPQPAVLVPRECRALWGFHRLSRSPTIAGQKILYNYHSGCVVDFCFVFCWGTNIFLLYWLVKGVVKNDKKNCLNFFVLQSVVVTLHFIIVTVFVNLMFITLVANNQWLLMLC